jgi:hypothetical protein
MTNNETALNTISKENLTAEEKTATKSSNGKLRLENLLKQPTNLLPVHQFWEHTLRWDNLQEELAHNL